ncbi:hypothetical protein [Asticcacaulis sp. AC402]|uniref:hypothetical protein n=1 Tax=Asticcacaulis sp. AC402 TaxID=1282361 RepID=UPI0003C3CE48|nr:hypothetical protein [Asticcacaulis sp. AC402]ESQ75209.1 hypothetical protein ABAC402_11105 [Asticcacaulis sp. AC402]
MHEIDNWFTVLALGSVALALWLIAILILRSLFHIVLANRRGRARYHREFDGWKAARVIVVIIGAAVAGITMAVRPAGLLPQVLIWAGLFAAICSPLLIAIWEIRVVDMEKPVNQDGPRRLGLAGKNLLYILGLPGMMTVFVMAGVVLNPERGGVDSLWNPPVTVSSETNFYLLPRPTACSKWLRQVGAVQLPFDGAYSPDHAVMTSEYWLDATLNQITFNAFDTSGCYLRRVDYNRENARMVAAVTAYNFILLFVISTIIYSVFKHKVRKGVAKATAHPADGV